jgi:hypothetical protein
MIKRGLLVFAILLLTLNSILAATTTCSLDTKLISQDPYPAIPGDFVKLVFQVNGIENPECGKVSIKFQESFPFTLEPGQTNPITIDSGTFERNYNSFLIAPYKVRVNENAADGETPLEVVTAHDSTNVLNNFSINIKDSRSDFEVFVKDYKPLTKMMTLEVLNIGENSIKALTIEIPKQKHIEIKGSNRNIVGDLDSNEYTTADFEVASAGGDITLNLYYTDSISVRRSLNKTITFDQTYFENRASDVKSSKTGYIILGIIVIVVVVLIYRRSKRRSNR